MSRKDEQREKNRKRFGQIAIGLLLVALMVLSIVQYADNGQQQNSLKFGKFKFVQNTEGFSVKANGQEYVVQDLPLTQNGTTVTFQNIFYELVTVEAPPGIGEMLRQSTLHVVTFDPATGQPAIQYIELSRLSIFRSMPNVINAVTTSNSTAYPGLPVADCADATGGVTVIKLIATNETAETTSIIREGDCLTVTANPQGTLAAKDYLILSYAGVIADGG